MATKKKPAPVALASFDDLDAAGIGRGYQPVFVAPPEVEDEPQKKTSRSALDVAKDVGISALKGAIAVPEAAVGLADLVTGGYAGKAAEAIGFRPGEAKQILDDAYSDPQKEAFRRVQAAEGFGDKLMEAVRNPSVIAHSIIESAPSIGAGGVAARAGMAVLPGMAPVVAGALGEGAVSMGSTAEGLRQQTKDGTLTTAQSAIAAGSGIATGALALVGGKIAQRLGIGDVDTMLAQAGRDPAMAKGVVRRVLEGAVSEGVLEELPQSVQEQVAQNAALGRPLDEGVDHAAVLGLLSGGVMGGGVNVTHAPEAVPVPTPAPSGPLSRAASAAARFPALPAPGMIPQGETIVVDEAGQAGTRAQQDLRRGSRQQPPVDVTDAGSARAVTPSPDVPVDGIAQAAQALQAEEATRQNLAMWMQRAEPMPMDRAQAIQQRGAEQGHDLEVVPHSAGRGFTVVPRAWVAPTMRGQTPGAAMLPMDDTPTGVMRADAQGNVRPETRVDQIDTQQIARQTADEMRRRAELGLTPDVEQAQARRNGELPPVARKLVEEAARRTANPEPITRQAILEAAGIQPGDKLNPKGEPYKTKGAAVRAQKSAGGELVQVDGGWVVRPVAQAEVTDAGGSDTAGRAVSDADGAGSADGERSAASAAPVRDEREPGMGGNAGVAVAGSGADAPVDAGASEQVAGVAEARGEEIIAYESGDAWVKKDNGQYTVHVAGATHSKSDSAYPLTEDGLSLAKARADFLSKGGKKAKAPAVASQKPTKVDDNAGSASEVEGNASQGANQEESSASIPRAQEEAGQGQEAEAKGSDAAGATAGADAGAAASVEADGRKPAELPRPWTLTQDEFAKRADYRKNGNSSNPWTANWGDAVLDGQNEEYDHPDLGKTVVSGGRFFKTKREAEVVARGAHKRAVRRALMNGERVDARVLEAYPDLKAQADKDAKREAAAPAPAKERKAVVAAPPVAEPPAVTRETITDAGEKIGGARKDRWKERGLAVADLDAMSDTEGAELAVKANVWKPDYEAIAEAADPVVASMVKVVYDSLAAKPKQDTPQGRRDYVRAMQAVRKVYGSVKSVQEAKDAYQKVREEFGVMVPTGSGTGFIQNPDKEKLAEARRVMFSVYKGRSDPFVFDYNALARAKKLAQDGFPAKGEPWKKRLVVRGHNGRHLTEQGRKGYLKDAAEMGTPLTEEQVGGNFYVVRAIGTGKTLGYYPTQADAEAGAKVIYERDMKGKKDSKAEPERPHLDELKRENLPQRIDRDVTAKDFIDHFGFRGVEFGNWSAQDERQRILNMAYDGLNDLAEIMGVPPRAMSLNGTLGMAFGARGTGRALAHYEPGKLVINMTKLRGGGSLAHEWAHALDHYFGELDRDDAYKGRARGASGWMDESQYDGVPVTRTDLQPDGTYKTTKRLRLANLRPELARAIDRVMNVITKAQVTKQQMLADLEAQLERTRQHAANESDPAIKAMYERAVENQRQNIEELKQEPDDKTFARGSSNYYKEAQKLSGKDGKPAASGYWMRPTEMFARAFESWVFDRVAAMGARSDYLVHGVEETRFAGGDYKGNPYPVAEERARINAAFDAMAATIKTKPGEDGAVVMFQRTEADKPAATADALTKRQAALQQLMDGIRSKWANSPEIIVVRDMQDERVPERVRKADAGQRAQGALGSVRGFYFQGRAYLVADALDSGEVALETLAHEVLGHAGLQGLFGAELKPILQQIAALRKKDVLAKAEEYGLEVDPYYVRQELPPGATDADVQRVVDARLRYSAEEVLAEMAQTTPTLGYVKRAIAAIRTWLRKHVPGFSKMQFSDAELIRSFVIPAREFVISGRAKEASVGGEAQFARGDEEASLDVPGFTSFEGRRLSDGSVTFNGRAKAGAQSYFAHLRVTFGENGKPRIQLGDARFETMTGKPVRGAANAKLEELMDGARAAALEWAAGGPLFSRATAKNLGEAIKATTVTDLKRKTGNKLADYRSLALQALGRRQLTEVYSDLIPELEHYNDLAQKMDAEKNDAGAVADKIAQDWGKLKDERELAELMHDATLAQIDPAKDYVKGDSQPHWAQLRNRWNKLTPEAQSVYKRARDTYERHYAEVREAIRDRIERSSMSKPAKARLLARMDAEFFDRIKGVYFPLARFGDYVIVVKDKKGDTVAVSRAETLNEAENLRAEMLKQFPRAAYNVGKILKSREFNAARDAVGRGFMQELYDMLESKGVADELQDSINQLYLSSMPDLSWAKHGIHRKGTPGFSQDARRAFAQNTFHGARYLAKVRYGDQLQQALDDMQEYVDMRSSDEGYDSVKAQDVINEMVKRHDNLMNPKTNPLSTALTSFGFIFHLGLSPASAVVNLTQTPLVAYPLMGAKWGFDKAGAALLKASNESAANKNDLSSVLTGDEKRAYEEAVKAGTIDVTLAHDLAGIAQGEDSKVMWKVRPVMRAASFLFHHAERFNRQATFLAAYRLAREEGKSHARAMDDATDMTYRGHFDYSSANRPRVMQGNVARVVLLFQQFAQNMVYTLSRQAYLSVKAAKPQERAEARKAFAGLLVSHAMGAGVLGLPLVGTLLGIASWLGSDDDEPWDAETALRNTLADAIGQKPAEVLTRGISRLGPWDISGRVGLDRLILPDVQEGLEGARLAESTMAAALGPVAGIGINLLRGLDQMADGEYQRGLESMMPSVLRGPLRALRYASEGAVDKTGISILDEVSPAAIAGQAMGFAPSAVRNAQEGKSAIYQADRRLGERRQDLMRAYAMAMLAGDKEGMADVQQDIRAFNEKNPNRRITPMNLRQSIAARRRRIQQAQQGIYLPKNRRDALAAGRFAQEDED